MEPLPNEDEYLYFSFTLPKFQIEFEQYYNQILIDLGMEIPFTSDADFGNITSLTLWINYVKQSTFIEVNEEGSQAAAATIVSGILGTPNFWVNKPFIYLICDDRSDTILFMGRVSSPEYE